MLLETADKIYFGRVVADKVYLGDILIWPLIITSPETIPGCVLALDAWDLVSGPVSVWNDRSSENNDVIVFTGSPVASRGFVTLTTTNVLQTSNVLPASVIGNNSRHVIMRMRTRNINGSFIGWGAAAAGALFDLWNYNPGTLIWHGYGGGFDTVSGAPAFTPDEWHIIEAFYDGSNVHIRCDDLTEAISSGLSLSTASNPLLLGQGRYGVGSNFDISGLYLYDHVLSAPERDVVINSLNSVHPWVPSDIAGLTTWLDANDYVSGSWTNKGNGPAITIVGTPAMTISSTLLNGKPVVRFMPNEGRVRSTWTDSVYDYTLVYLMRFVGPNAGRAFSVQYPPSNLLVGIHSSGYDQMYDNGTWRQGPEYGTWPTTWKMYGADSQAGQGAAFFIDGVQIGTRTGGTGGFTNGWGISGYDATGAQETMDLEVAELLLYNRRLSDPERQQVEGYLRDKWITPQDIWTPASITGLGLWLEADKITGVAEGGTITTWPDSSGNNHNAYPAIAAPLWRQAGMNNKPTVEFTNSPTKALIVPGWGTVLEGKTEYTMFQVMSQNEFGSYPVITSAPYNSTWTWLTEWAPSPAGGIYWGQPGNNYNLYHANVPTSTPTLITYSVQTIGGPKLYKNGTEITAFTPNGTFGQAVPYVGTDVLLGGYYNNSLGLTGQVAAVLWYDRFLIDSERIQVEDYLKQKYGI